VIAVDDKTAPPTVGAIDPFRIRANASPPPALDWVPPIEDATNPTIAPPSPVSKYAASRARARRNQTIIAIILLAAVLALCVVLVWMWVVRNGVDRREGDWERGRGGVSITAFRDNLPLSLSLILPFSPSSSFPTLDT
jgi:hypothetical protein